jgi:hypothetical protein
MLILWLMDKIVGRKASENTVGVTVSVPLELFLSFSLMLVLTLLGLELRHCPSEKAALLPLLLKVL